MQCPLIGLSAVLYTSFVYYDVLLKANPDWQWLLTIFCLTWTGVYLLKRAFERYPYPNQSIRHSMMITTGSCIISMAEGHTQTQLTELTQKQCDASTDGTVFFAANVFFATYFLLMRQATECQWSKRSKWLLEAVRFMMIVTFASGFLDKTIDECVMDRNVYIFHEIIFSIMVGCTGFNMFSVIMASLELKEDLERAAPAAALIEVVDDGISPPTEDNNAAEGAISEEETVQG